MYYCLFHILANAHAIVLCYYAPPKHVRCVNVVMIESHTSRLFLVGAMGFEDIHPFPSLWCHCDS